MIDGTTTLHGIIGTPVKHSLSPAMHNAAFEKLNLNSVYLAFEVEPDQVKNAINGIRALEIRGVNVTMPHKSAVMDFLDELDPIAIEIGAVNTIVNSNGILIGYNTDASGAMEALEEKTKLSGKTALVLGAGGAAKAIAFALSAKGAKVTIANRDFDSGEQLAQSIEGTAIQLNQASGVDTDIIINATPVGMHPNTEEMPVEEKVLKNKIVFDSVYNPVETKLLKVAKKNGCETITGLEMLLNQATHAFELWTGKKPPKETMRNALLKGLKQ